MRAAGPFRAAALRRVLGCLLLLGLLAGVSVAQSGNISNYGTMPAGLAPGSPEGSSGLSGIENISPYNGTVNASLPLLKIGGRGGGGYTITLPIKKTPWTVENRMLGYACGGAESGDPDPDCHIWDANLRTQWWTPAEPGYSPGLLQGHRVGSETYVCPGSTGPVNYGRTFTVLTFTSPDGAEHHLYDEKNGGNVLQWDCVSNFPDPNRKRVFSSKDGSGLTFIADEDIDDYASPDSMTSGGMFWPAGYLKTSDGTVYRFSWGRAEWMRDRNGNKITFTYDTHSPSCGASPASRRVTKITDSLGREVDIYYDVPDAQYGTHDQIVFNRVNGQQRVIRVSKTTLANALRPNSGYQVKTYTGLFPQVSAPLTTCNNSQTFNPTVVSSVWLQDGVRRYQFYYNEYNELARLDLPTGGKVEYDYWAGADGSWNGSPAYPSGQIGQKITLGEPKIFIYRRLRERRLYPSVGAASPTLLTGFSRETGSPSGEYVQVDQRDPAELDTAGKPKLLARQRHYYNGAAAGTLYWAIGTVQDGVADYMQGKELRTEDLATDGSDTVLRRVDQTWDPGNIYGAPDGTPWSTYLKDMTLSLLDTTTGLYKVSRQEFSYDQYNNQTDVYEYDFGTAGSGTAGPLLRRAHTEYETAPAYTDALTGAHLRRLPKQQWVSSDASGATKLSLTTYAYDQYALTNRPSITGYDAAFAGTTARGNATSVTRYANIAGGIALTATSTYDIAGNVTSSTDARGKTTHYDFTDNYVDGVNRYTYALPKSVTTPVPDPSGAYGSTSSLVTTRAYDFTTGNVRTVTDANGATTTYEYVDVFDRVTKVTAPSGGSTTYNYNRNSAGDYVHVESVMNTAGAKTIGYLFSDGLGRRYRSFHYENQDPAKPWLTDDTEYDPLGRVKRDSRPYRSTGSESAMFASGKWAETAYDALGRVLTVTTRPDGAQVVTAYSGTGVTVTDQAGKARRTDLDAAGRVRQVVEDPHGQALVTEYTYDALNNLRRIDQGDQDRYFMYDALSRLTREKKPEHAANGSLAVADPVTGNAQWSTGFDYDGNGNLVWRSDARGITATFGYDALNRNTTIRYSDGTRGEDRHYDAEPNAKGRLWRTGAAGDFTDHLDRDTSGRPARNRQWFYSGGMWRYFDTTYTYDLADHVKTQTYPSTHTTTYEYDQMGRVNHFAGSLGDGVSRVYASGIVYDEMGGRSQEQYGTQTPVYNKSYYNNRGQLSEIRVATTANDTFWNRGAIINHYSDFSWAGSGTDNNGNLKKQEVYIPGDDAISGYSLTSFFYYYDALNRLDIMREVRDGANSWIQDYDYDRYGNRTINAASTYGNGINNKQFSVNPLNNRLGVPAGQAGVMGYDNAGNLTTDTYGGNGTRAYDAESRMTQETHSLSNAVTGRYSYDGAGRRVRRTAEGQEWWYVYGLGGELIAEYGASFPGVAQQEYGYRGNELLVTASGYGTQGLQADYFNGLNFETPVMTRTDANVNFDWGGGGPGGGVGIDYFTTRWTGYVTPRFSETYTFSTLTDDGVRLWVDGKLLIDKWVDQAPTQWNGQITLQAGRRYQIKMEFYEHGGGATAKLLWSSPSQWSEAVPASQLMPPEGGSSVNWIVTDQLNTPRMVLDQTGSLTKMSRHDYLPFGEEIGAGVGGRTWQQGYTGDGIRQQFTGQERDWESGLHFYQSRYYSAVAGRFTSADSVGGKVFNPQSLNLYAYVVNNPLKWIDPTGHRSQHPTDEDDENSKHGLDENNQIWEVDDEGNVTGAHSLGSESVTVDGRPPELDSSLHDLIPVWGGFRRLLFYNHTGQPERALGAFYTSSLDGALLIQGFVARGGGSITRILVDDVVEESGVIVRSTAQQAARHSNCFEAGTLVHTVAGLVAIEDIRPGDDVLSWNEATGQLEYKDVVRTYTRVTLQTLAVEIEGDAGPIITTPNHPFYVRLSQGAAPAAVDEGGWVAAARLRVGDEVRRPSGDWVKVSGIRGRVSPTRVYNFQVADNHDYFVTAEGVLVHNQSPISMDDAIEKAVNHVGSKGELEVTKGGNFQFRVTERNAQGQIETRLGRLDVNPRSGHVRQQGPHLNIETRIKGVKNPVKNDHIPIHPHTIRKGDVP